MASGYPVRTTSGSRFSIFSKASSPFSASPTTVKPTDCQSIFRIMLFRTSSSSSTRIILYKSISCCSYLNRRDSCAGSFSCLFSFYYRSALFANGSLPASAAGICFFFVLVQTGQRSHDKVNILIFQFLNNMQVCLLRCCHT